MVDKIIDQAFNASWGNKLNNAYMAQEREYLRPQALQYLSNQGHTTIPGTDIPLSSVTFDEEGYFAFNTSFKYDPYQQLLDQAQARVNKGQIPEEAVSRTMVDHIKEQGSLADSFNFNLQGQESLAGKVWCGTANCVQSSKVTVKLLRDLGVESKTIYGLGGTFPYIHSATQTPSGVILYGGLIVPLSEFRLTGSGLGTFNTLSSIPNSTPALVNLANP